MDKSGPHVVGLLDENTGRIQPLRKSQLSEEASHSNKKRAPAELDDTLLAKSEQIRSSHDDRNRDRRKSTKKRERQIFVPSVLSSTSEEFISARVVRADGAYFHALLPDGTVIIVRGYKGTRTANPGATLIAVGDEIRIHPTLETVALVEEVAARKTKLSRRAAGRGFAFEQVVVANVDTLVIVASIVEPRLRSGIIDRYIVAALEGGLSIVIAINKVDLANAEEREEVEYFQDVYSELGYQVFPVSSVTHEGIAELRETVTGKTSVFAGHSGVGKSSIINAIFGKEIGKTGVLSRKYKRGAHTTTSSVIIPISDLPGTYLVDTPGVREFSNYDLDPQNLKFSFVEFLPYQSECQIANCSHIHEPGCAVLEALEEDKISIERYTSYAKLMEEAKAAERKRIDKL